MNFLEYYKPKNLWKLCNNELNPQLDIHSMIYINAAKEFAQLCKSMNCTNKETFCDIYTSISLSALKLYQIYGYGEISASNLILFSICNGAKSTDIETFKNILTNIIKFGDKKILASYLGCLSDIAENLGIDRIQNIINDDNYTLTLEPKRTTLK